MWVRNQKHKTPLYWMKVLHIESGLGNQMLDYCDILAVKKANPGQDIYIENLIYQLPECDKVIKQWNGYELESIFGIKEKNVSELFSAAEWESILYEIKESEFWNDNWRFPPVFVDIFHKHGLVLENRFINYRNEKEGIIKKLISSEIAQEMKRAACRIKPLSVKPSRSFDVNSKDTFEGHTLSYMYKGAGIELIEKEIKDAFVFSNPLDCKNARILQKIEKENSVSIHLRRGDGLAANQKYFNRGYYKKAVELIMKRVAEPVFYLFSDPGSIDWAKAHLVELGLDRKKVDFVDWNCGCNSYQDMRLMMSCKHNIISFSSFSWWASYLNCYNNKITISPEPKILTTDWV